MSLAQPFSLPSFTVKDMWKADQMSLAPTWPVPLYVVCTQLSPQYLECHLHKSALQWESIQASPHDAQHM